MPSYLAYLGILFPLFALGAGIVGIVAAITAPTFGGRVSKVRVRLSARILSIGAFALLLGCMCVWPALFTEELAVDPAYLARRMPGDGLAAGIVLVLLILISGTVLISGWGKPDAQPAPAPPQRPSAPVRSPVGAPSPADAAPILSVEEAAASLGITPAALHDLLRQNVLRGQRVGTRTYIRRAEVERYRQSQGT